MKIIILLSIVSLMLLCCKDRSDTYNWNEQFNVNEYILMETKNDNQGNKSIEFYRHKRDSTKFFTKTYWDNGKLQGAIFYTKKLKDGPFKMYDTAGQVVFEGMYINDIQNGLALYYKRGEIVDFSVFYNGNELFLDSLSKNKIMDRYR